jgi:predicted component of type VI protein secretion system
MPAQLLALDNGVSILLDKPVLLVGRHPECDIQIDSRKISRRHCCIAQVNDYLVIRDLGSTNGIRINGVRVVEGRLSPGDEVTIGNNRYQVQWDSIAPVKPPARPAAAAAPRAVADELLEECDEPVPLVEPDDAVAPVAPPAPAPAPPARKEESRILPERLDLAPRSDIVPGNGAGPPAPA